MKETRESKFREWFTASGKYVVAGKNSKNNEELIAQVEPDETVLHTALPGSPFVNIKGKAKKADIRDAALFCAKYSQAWRDTKNDVKIHVFFGKDIHKSKLMKEGTFGVNKFSEVIAKKKDIELI
jgi:predicted ribosome quality control (RQC) complex YloA/Tae2 family protein